jgi:hypothetical protein
MIIDIPTAIKGQRYRRKSESDLGAIQAIKISRNPHIAEKIATFQSCGLMGGSVNVVAGSGGAGGSPCPPGGCSPVVTGGFSLGAAGVASVLVILIFSRLHPA